MGYDPNQPRDDHGRWASEGGVAAFGLHALATDDVTGEPTVLKGGRMPQFNEAAETRRAQGLAEKYGIDTSKVEVNMAAPERVVIGGRDLGAEAGHYDPATEKVVFTAGEVDESVAAHEFQHLKNDRVFTQFSKELGPARAALKSGVSQADVDAKYPTYAALRDPLLEHGGSMAQEDGVSGYSRQYWKDWESTHLMATVGGHSPSGAAADQDFTKYHLALDETLADRSRLEYEQRTGIRGATPTVYHHIVSTHPHFDHLYHSINEQFTRLQEEQKLAKSGLVGLGLPT